MPDEKVEPTKEEEITAKADEAGKKAGEAAKDKGATPEEVKAAVEKARKEEKDKLYSQLEGLKSEITEIRETLKAEREEKERIRKEAEKKAEEERKSKLSDTEKQQEVLNRLEEQLNNERSEREKFRRELEDRERNDQLRRHREKLIEANRDKIIPELVSGNSVEELDSALEVAKARYEEYAEKFKQSRGEETRRNMPRSTNPDLEALEELELSKDLTQIDQDKYLKDEDYRKQIKAELENEYARLSGRS